MFKVSFKDAPKNPSKTVVVTGRKVSVLLLGTMVLPDFWHKMPDEIIEWLSYDTHFVAWDEDIATNTIHLKVVGHALCHENDLFDYTFGERLAESRAKQKMYDFFAGLCNKLCNYYVKLLSGENGVHQDLNKYNSLLQKEKKHELKLLNNE